jgi:MFS-type transporter involved in bile tolerance (Atg22 family)
VGTGILSTCIAGTFLLVGSPLSIWHMGERKARTTLKGNVVKATFSDLYHLALVVKRDYSQAFIYLWSYAIGAAGASGIITIASTYFVSELKLSAAGFGIVVAIVLLVGMPCAFICGRVMNDFGMKPVLLAIYVVWTALGVITPLVMYKEEHKLGSYILGAIYGILLAMFFTVNPALFASLIPPKREAEFMGLYVFFAYLIRWLPLIIYGACDNSGGPRLGLGVCGTIFFFGGGITLCFVDTSKAEEQRMAEAKDTKASAEDG